ncbi:phosphatidylinositol N-acetylglucosaminyltransferase subunit H isoform X1 [Latimeria chalumnae]|uniref:Phosphatidylinositol glycan anchor biosynthesis class H n=1 Tax=Latimeria chalumnae TaxID=7897 RepID=H3A9I8_LATCH|nr:PREDICTED: phosphatidylinositol N-acetylglucosaminyltransferase subunit H [Latimeria chalumnae]|eukprot:XP_006001196.1 PREDICTED: phosphatidylinositol N-acetylglucosaminyltransferase subunit H [Latimeria chalumnae]
MEEEPFMDINGNHILLQRQSYSDLCREFTVSSPKLSLRSVTSCVCAVWLAAYAIFYYTQNSAVLSSAILVTLVGMMVHIHFVKTEHETLLIIGSLGIQMTASYASGRESTTFIEMSKVKDIVINEAIYMQRIIYYLCILLKDPKDPTRVTELVPVFQSSKPRLDCLVEVYRSCQEILGFKETSL